MLTIRCPHCATPVQVPDAAPLVATLPRPLTPAQHAVLSIIDGSLRAKGYAPSYDEIATARGYHSLSTVHEHLTNLKRKGWIDASYGEARSITMLHPLPGASR